ncbi:MAG: hypothetical protein GY847_19515 [Proteobacteria bacterium]|nr:hypothetical protein [Pseudomonadota bacterium]
MNAWPRLLLLALLSFQMLSCGSKQPQPVEPEEPESEPKEAEEEEEQDPVVSAQSRIKEWLGTDLTERIASLGKELGKNIGLKMAGDKAVIGKAKGLSKDILKDPEVKKALEKISDKATEGLGNKLTLGWKAIQAGGIDAYKKKVKEDAKRVAVEVLTEHLRERVLKDERTAKMLKGFAPALKVQGKVAAVALQENLSPRVTKKILSIALRISAEGDKKEMADRVEQWIDRCQDHAKDEVEKLIRAVAELKSVQKTIGDLAIEVLEHKRTRKELIELAKNVINDADVNRSLVKVYDAAAFEKGDSQIRRTIVDTLNLPTVDRELFATMERLAGAEGAGPMIGRHTVEVSEDPEMAELVENFVVSVLEGCGDPTENDS